MKNPKAALRALGTALALLWTSAHAAEPYPVPTLRIIVQFGSSSASDPVARKLAELLAKQMDITTIVENREGGSGLIASLAAANASPNGGTVIMVAGPSPFATVPLLQKKPAYDPEAQFTPIARVMSSALILVGSKHAPFTTYAEMRDYAKRNPGKLSYASSGVGSASHLSMESLKMTAGLDIKFVPYKNTGQQMTDTIGGQIELNVPSLPGGYPHVKSGAVRALAVGSLKRSALMPDVPTFAEVTGQPDLEAAVWYGILGPRGMPPAVVSRLSTEIGKALATPQMISLIESLGAEPSYMPNEEFSANLKRSVTNVRKLVEHLNLPLQE
jgi:tripartite-type tricarboxylate transporter receptor subunit TctC